MDRKYYFIILILIFTLIIVIGAYFFISMNNNDYETKNIIIVNNTTDVENISKEVKPTYASGKYGYCAICKAPLSQAEALDDYTQGKVCGNCAKNPYYQTNPGAEYANRKMEEAFPECYNGIAEE